MTSVTRSKSTPGLTSALKPLFVLLALALCACGRPNVIYPGADDTAEARDLDEIIRIDDPGSLPDGFYDHSVNQAFAALSLDEGAVESLAIRLQTSANSNASGGFNGNGTGNRALLGIGGFSRSRLSDITPIGYEGRVFSGASSPSVLLIVDTKCDGTGARTLVADGSLLSTLATGSGYTRYAASIHDPIWVVTGAEIKDPSNPAVVLVPSEGSGSLASLDDLISKYPTACVRNTATSDPSLPRDLPVTGIILSLGSATTNTAAGILINRVSVASEVRGSADWY